MTPILFKRRRFSPVIIQYAVWLYTRFTLSFRNVVDLLAERGIDVSNETVRRWFLKFGRLVAVNLRRSRPRVRAHWHIDEIVIKSAAGDIGCGARSTTKARCWTF
ncbi:IS6 family transposase [Pelagibius litoralis]|uniref:IS6 family transposase n=1 Tax=Pelagibius litoralis TaxID=374515 RepID=A0A967F1P3_9PROT|nr:IS6 family transposase [Pelagibius litoralis]NIA71404.1 IS6 family transposase [Pelagibius litoralis]